MSSSGDCRTDRTRPRGSQLTAVAALALLSATACCNGDTGRVDSIDQTVGSKPGAARHFRATIESERLRFFHPGDDQPRDQLWLEQDVTTVLTVEIGEGGPAQIFMPAMHATTEIAAGTETDIWFQPRDKGDYSIVAAFEPGQLSIAARIRVIDASRWAQQPWRN